MCACATLTQLHCFDFASTSTLHPSYRLDYVINKDDFEVDAEGYLALLPKPGLGIVVDEAAVRKAAASGHDWKDREWELPDGTPTTW